MQECKLLIFYCSPVFTAATKLGQGYFLHVSVILFGGGSASVHTGIPNPPARQTPSPLARQTPSGKADPPWAVHVLRYCLQAGGMHPTGMQFLFHFVVQEAVKKHSPRPPHPPRRLIGQFTYSERKRKGSKNKQQISKKIFAFEFAFSRSEHSLTLRRRALSSDWSVHRFIFRNNPYHFFRANQQKVNRKICSFTRCSLTVNECDRHILEGIDQSIVVRCLTRIVPCENFCFKFSQNFLSKALLKIPYRQILINSLRASQNRMLFLQDVQLTVEVFIRGLTVTELIDERYRWRRVFDHYGPAINLFLNLP